MVNLQKLVIFGEGYKLRTHDDNFNSLIELAKKILHIINDKDLLNSFYPFHKELGISNSDIHNFILSYLILVGDKLDFSPVSESRLIDKSNAILDDRFAAKRPDVRWYMKDPPFHTKVLIEYERQKIEEKVENLIIMSEDAALNGERNLLCILIYHVDLKQKQPNLSNALELIHNRIRNSPNYNLIKGNAYLIIKNVLLKKEGSIKIERFDKMRFIYDGCEYTHLLT